MNERPILPVEAVDEHFGLFDVYILRPMVDDLAAFGDIDRGR